MTAEFIRLALAVACCFAAVIFLSDAMQFRRLSRGQYLTPWYPPQWWKAPYTHAALALHEGREYWTLNAIGSECWHVREVPVGRVVFWTALERIPIADGEG